MKKITLFTAAFVASFVLFSCSKKEFHDNNNDNGGLYDTPQEVSSRVSPPPPIAPVFPFFDGSCKLILNGESSDPNCDGFREILLEEFDPKTNALIFSEQMFLSKYFKVVELPHQNGKIRITYLGCTGLIGNQPNNANEISGDFIVITIGEFGWNNKTQISLYPNQPAYLAFPHFPPYRNVDFIYVADAWSTWRVNYDFQPFGTSGFLYFDSYYSSTFCKTVIGCNSNCTDVQNGILYLHPLEQVTPSYNYQLDVIAGGNLCYQIFSGPNFQSSSPVFSKGLTPFIRNHHGFAVIEPPIPLDFTNCPEW